MSGFICMSCLWGETRADAHGAVLILLSEELSYALLTFYDNGVHRKAFASVT